MSNYQDFESSKGARIVQIPLDVFPGMLSFAYLVFFENYLVLIDAGSGLGESHPQLAAGLEAEKITWQDLTHIFITHGHIDHFGGLSTIQSLTRAKIGIHELDRRVLTDYQGRRAHGLHRLSKYLIEAGVPEGKRGDLLALYELTKNLYQSIRVDFTFEDVGMRIGPFEFLHVPGHSPGHTVIRLHDILFCGDHILSDITPHQAPEQLIPWTGLEHYLGSLTKLSNWSNGNRLTLCGHERLIHDLSKRISEINAEHINRLNDTQNFYQSPGTVNELSEHLFGTPGGYDALLAVEEAGAHVEYLYLRGNLRIQNLEALESLGAPIPMVYESC